MSVTLPPILKKLALKLCDISLLSSSLSYKSLSSSYAFIYSLSLAGGLSSSRYYKWKSCSLYRLYLKSDIGYYLGSLLNPVQLALYSSLFQRLQTVRILSTSYSLSVETCIGGGGSFTYPGSGSSTVFLSLSSKKTGCIYINLGRATLYEFLTCLIISYRPAIQWSSLWLGHCIFQFLVKIQTLSLALSLLPINRGLCPVSFYSIALILLYELVFMPSIYVQPQYKLPYSLAFIIRLQAL